MTQLPEHPADVVDKHTVERLAYRLAAIERLCETADRGFVCWEPIPPAGVSHWQHNMSFVDAVMTGLNFCGTKMKDEWLLVGTGALSLVRSLPHFKVDRGEETDRAMRIGVLCETIVVYFSWKTDPERFYMGTADTAATGLVSRNSAAYSHRT